jgi:hypothetical protein
MLIINESLSALNKSILWRQFNLLLAPISSSPLPS